MIKFRKLTADEIECRIQQLRPGRKDGKVYALCLLYKDARCDMRILDETVGPDNWQRRHDEHKGNLFCSVGVNVNYDKGGERWVWKEDAGAESNQDAEKGHASDSFKRACFNWGIGRELYTAPDIFFELKEGEYFSDGTDRNGKPKYKSYAKFRVSAIEYEGDTIRRVAIEDSKGNVRFCK